MSLLNGEELEQRYRPFFENKAIQAVVNARTPNDADPVDEETILRFVRDSEAAHARYVRSAFRRIEELGQPD